MKKWKQGFRRLLTGMLTVSMLAGTVPGMIPFASARAADVTPELTLTPEVGSSTGTAYIQNLFNHSVLGYGSVGWTDSNVEGPNKTWTGSLEGGFTQSGSTDYVENGNLTVVSAADAGGTGIIDDTGVFHFHLAAENDYDSTGERYDRQRIEIKSHDKTAAQVAARSAKDKPVNAENEVLAELDDVYTYRWKFKLPENCYSPQSNGNSAERLKNFFHIFQLKATKGAENSMPVATFTIEDGYLMFQHVAISGRGMGFNNVIGPRIALKDIEGKWLQAEVTVLYRDEGYIHVRLIDLEDNNSELINEGAELDTWRRPEVGEGSATYESDYKAVANQGIRCKWGLYRKYIPDASGYALTEAEGVRSSNSGINTAKIPSWWKEADMWLGDLEVVKENRSNYQFPVDYKDSYRIPAAGEKLPKYVPAQDGGIDYMRVKKGDEAVAKIKVCSFFNNDKSDKLTTGDESTYWGTAADLLRSENADAMYWFAVDLGEPRDINKFLIQFNTTSNKLKDYQIYYAKGDDAKAAYDAIIGAAEKNTVSKTANPLKGFETVWQEVKSADGKKTAGYHPGANKYVKAYQMNIFDAGKGDFEALQDVQYLLVAGETVHDNSGKSIRTGLFKVINTEEQPKIEQGVETVKKNYALKSENANVSVKVSSAASNNPADNLIDNNDTSTWNTISGQVTCARYVKYWAAIDLGEEQEINRFRIKWGAVNNRLSSYQIFYSDTAADYDNLTTFGTSVTAGNGGKPSNTKATWNPLTVEGNNWQPATNKIEKAIATDDEVIEYYDPNAQYTSEKEAMVQSLFNVDEDDESDAIVDSSDGGETEDTDATGNDTEEDEPVIEGESKEEESDEGESDKGEFLETLPNQDSEPLPVIAALPSVWGKIARSNLYAAAGDADTSNSAANSVKARYVLLVCDVRSAGVTVGNSIIDPGAIKTASFEVGLVKPIEVEITGCAETLAPASMQPTNTDKNTVLSALLPKRISVNLSSNQVYALNVSWNTNDMEAVNLQKPGTYTIRGTLQQPDGITLKFGSGVSDTVTRTIIIEQKKVEEPEPSAPDDNPGSAPDNEASDEYTRPNRRPASSGSANTSSSGTKPSEEKAAADTNPPTQTAEPGNQPFPLNFRDIEHSDWFADAVSYVSSRGMMSGNGGNFRPNDILTRGMVAQILCNLEGGQTNNAASFPDVTDGDWFANAVSWATSSGIMSGYSNGLFGANDSVTREQLALTLYRYAQSKRYDVSRLAELSGFVDGDGVSDWASEAVRWAVANGLLSGKTGMQLDAQGTATRAEVASVLMRFCEMIAQ